MFKINLYTRVWIDSPKEAEMTHRTDAPKLIHSMFVVVDYRVVDPCA